MLKGRRISRTKSGQGNRVNANDSDISDQSGASSDEDEEDSGGGNHNNHIGGGHASTATSTRRTSNFGLEDHTSQISAMASPAQSGSLAPPSRGQLHRKRGGTPDVEDGPVPGSNTQDPDDEFSPSGQSILGLQTDVWEKLLSPPRAWHKRRFEVGINDLAFVGWPVFVREDGAWRKGRRKKNKEKEKKSRRVWEGGELGHNEEEIPEEEDEDGEGREQTRTSADREDKGRDSEDKDSMTMFNVVFVLDPALLEYSSRLREIYDNIIKKLAKALKWEEARTDYVWRESQHILHVKEMAREKSMFGVVLVAFW